MEKYLFIRTFFLDLWTFPNWQKAFDTANGKILLAKLENIVMIWVGLTTYNSDVNSQLFPIRKISHELWRETTQHFEN